MQHDGTQPGYLYVVAEPVHPADVYPHPHPVNAARWEWVTTRELRVTLLGPTEVREEERLTDADIAALRRKQAAAGTPSFMEPSEPAD